MNKHLNFLALKIPGSLNFLTSICTYTPQNIHATKKSSLSFSYTRNSYTVLGLYLVWFSRNGPWWNLSNKTALANRQLAHMTKSDYISTWSLMSSTLRAKEGRTSDLVKGWGCCQNSDSFCKNIPFKQIPRLHWWDVKLCVCLQSILSVFAVAARHFSPSEFMFLKSRMSWLGWLRSEFLKKSSPTIS